jgi:hypothetical protein
MRLILALILMVPMLASGAVVRLTDCGTLPGSISAASPFDLGACDLANGDDIATLLKDIAAEWGAVHVRAPLQTVSVIHAGTTAWAGEGVTNFTFTEAASARYTFTITHVPVTKDAQMWEFVNATNIKIGGPNLAMTFFGTHPGLGQGKPCTGDLEACAFNNQYGLIFSELNDGSNPDLLDMRFNCWNSWSSCILVIGGANGSDGEATANRWKQANFAGRHVAGGINVISGVMDVWTDPDRTVMMDPWNRSQGWDGAIAGTSGGIDYGCFDSARAQTRYGAGAGFQYARHVTGGVTLQWGTPQASMFVPKYIGNSVADPYIVRASEWGHSGPTSITGLPEGVRIKSGVIGGIAKYDPAPTYGLSAPFRFKRFHILPTTYGNGFYTAGITSGCAEGNETNNNFNASRAWIWRAEASRDNVSAQYITAYFDVQLQNAERWNEGSTSALSADTAGSGNDVTPGPTDPDRSFGHVIRVLGGSAAPRVNLLDTSTLTGPGSTALVTITRLQIDAGSDDYLNPIDNTITDTRISGVIQIGVDASNTVVDNVDFTNASAVIMTVDSGSDVAMSDLCVPSGKQITGSGTVTIDGGSALTLPYTFGSTLTDCSITENAVPNSPGTN